MSMGVHVCGWCAQSMCKHIHMCGRQRWLPPTLSIWLVLIYMLRMHMFVCVLVDMCICRPQVYVRSLLPFHLFKTGLLTKAGVYQFGCSTISPVSWYSSVSASLRAGITKPSLLCVCCGSKLKARILTLHFTTEPSLQLPPPFLHWTWSSLSTQAY